MRVADIVGELFVRRLDQESAAEFSRLKIDIVEAKKLSDLAEKSFSADQQFRKVPLEVQDEKGEIVVASFRLAILIP